MDTVRMKKHQERLLKRKRQILSTVRRLNEQIPEKRPQMNFDWWDDAYEENEVALIDHLSDAHGGEITRIDRALGRMLSGTYGDCLACRRPVEKWRLESFPETEFCLECQKLRGKFKKAS